MSRPGITTPEGATIWQRLADNHDITVAYYTLRTYVASRRAAVRPGARAWNLTWPGSRQIQPGEHLARERTGAPEWYPFTFDGSRKD